MSARTEGRSLLLLVSKKLQANWSELRQIICNAISATLLEIFVHETVLLHLFLSVSFSQLLLDPGAEQYQAFFISTAFGMRVTEQQKCLAEGAAHRCSQPADFEMSEHNFYFDATWLCAHGVTTLASMNKERDTSLYRGLVLFSGVFLGRVLCVCVLIHQEKVNYNIQSIIPKPPPEGKHKH